MRHMHSVSSVTLLPEENMTLGEVLSDNSSCDPGSRPPPEKSSAVLGPHLPQSPGASISSLCHQHPENRDRRGSPSRSNGGSPAFLAVCSSSTARLIVKPSPDLRPYSFLPKHTSPIARFVEE